MLISHDKDVMSFLQLTKMHNNNRMSVEFLHIETKPSTQQTSSDEFVRFRVKCRLLIDSGFYSVLLNYHINERGVIKGSYVKAIIQNK